MQITLGQQYNVGEKPTVILYIYINRHAGTPEKQTRDNVVYHTHGSSNIHYKGFAEGRWPGRREPDDEHSPAS